MSPQPDLRQTSTNMNTTIQKPTSSNSTMGPILFDGQNYDEWVTYAKAHLGAKGLSSYVKGEIEEPEPIRQLEGENDLGFVNRKSRYEDRSLTYKLSMNRATGEIRMLLDGSLKEKYLNEKYDNNPKALWDAIAAER